MCHGVAGLMIFTKTIEDYHLLYTILMMRRLVMQHSIVTSFTSTAVRRDLELILNFEVMNTS
jgi:hypothetical protein